MIAMTANLSTKKRYSLPICSHPTANSASYVLAVPVFDGWKARYQLARVWYRPFAAVADVPGRCPRAPLADDGSMGDQWSRLSALTKYFMLVNASVPSLERI